jgi:hypothetical protein
VIDLFGGEFPGREKQRSDLMGSWGGLVPMGPGYFAYETMSTKQPDNPRDAAAEPPGFHGTGRPWVEKEGAKVLVPEPVDAELAAVGLFGDLGATGEIGNPLAHLSPGLLAVWIALFVAKDLESGRLIDRGLDTEDGALFVVEFDGIVVHAVLDADPLGAIFEVADDLAAKAAVDLAAEESHHVAAGQSRDPMADQGAVDGREVVRVIEEDVRSPFALHRKLLQGSTAFSTQISPWSIRSSLATFRAKASLSTFPPER